MQFPDHLLWEHKDEEVGNNVHHSYKSIPDVLIPTMTSDDRWVPVEGKRCTYQEPDHDCHYCPGHAGSHSYVCQHFESLHLKDPSQQETYADFDKPNTCGVGEFICQTCLRKQVSTENFRN
jgi:hypothetical protein